MTRLTAELRIPHPQNNGRTIRLRRIVLLYFKHLAENVPSNLFQSGALESSTSSNRLRRQRRRPRLFARLKLAAKPLTSRRRNSFPPSISIGRVPKRSSGAFGTCERVRRAIYCPSTFRADFFSSSDCVSARVFFPRARQSVRSNRCGPASPARCRRVRRSSPRPRRSCPRRVLYARRSSCCL